LPPEFAPVVEAYGLGMVQAVLDAGLCSEAVGKLVAIGRASGRGEILPAAMILARAYNRISSLYCHDRGWTEGMLAECDRDLQLAFAGKIWTPEQGKIILDS
jgi:hypothetical protein